MKFKKNIVAFVLILGGLSALKVSVWVGLVILLIGLAIMFS